MSEETDTKTPETTSAPEQEAKSPQSDEQVEKLLAENKQYRHERNEARLQAAIASKCVAAGVSDVEAATKLINRDAITFQDGKAVGVEEAFSEMLKSRSYLVKRPSKGGTSGSNPADTGTSPITRDSLASMSKADINANWDKISAQLQKGKL